MLRSCHKQTLNEWGRENRRKTATFVQNGADMTAIPSAFDEIARLMAAGMKAEELIAYEIPTAYTDRYQVLVVKEKEGVINEEERRELDALLMINHVISLAKLMAMKKLEAA